MEEAGLASGSTVRVMSYNLYGWNALHNDQKKENMFRHIKDFNPDILGVQEDEGQSYSIIGHIGHDYRYDSIDTHTVVIYYSDFE